MRRIAVLLFFIGSMAMVNGQNLQMHYDMGKDRGYVTTTLEMFKPDKWGSTFFFVDFNYDETDVKGVSLGYMEIARGIKFWDCPFELHAEYNGGFGQFADEKAGFQGAYQINDAWLFGGNYTWNNADFTRVFTLQTLYKYIRDKHDASFQVTGVWAIHMANRKFTFSGFADFWREDNAFSTGEKTDFVFLSEPQLWYNATANLSLGGEVELGNNFGGYKGFKACPTLAAKWTF
jgi:hypothetical protein